MAGFDWKNAEFEQHPAIGLYAPGGYLCRCSHCGKTFAGAKRSINCYTCASANTPTTKPTGGSMSKYRKRPVEVEAIQWHPGVQHPGVFGEGDPCYPPYVITIHEQRAYLSDGDWILPEPKPCRFYPCKPDVFDATYEPVA